MWYDFVVAAILLFCLLRGLSKGFVWQLAAVGSVVLCFAFAETASVVIAPYLNVNPPLNRWVSMLLLYVLCSFACFAVARGLKSTLEKRQFEDYDRHLGGLFGLLKGAGLAVVVTFFAVTLSAKLRPTVLTSYSGYAAAVVMHNLSPVFPEGLGRYIEPYLDNYEGLDEDGFGPRLAAGAATTDGDDLFGDAGGLGEDRSDGTPGPGDGAFGGFGWEDEPGARRVVRGTGRSGGDRDAPMDGGFGDDPGTGQGGWLNDDGGFNTDRLAGEAARVGRGVLNDVPEDTQRRFGEDLADSARRRLSDGADSARRRLGDEVDRRIGDLFGDDPFGANTAGRDRRTPAAPAAAPTLSRDELLDRIAARYKADPTERDLFRRRADGVLSAASEGVAGDVLRDWWHDLRADGTAPAADAGPDPNPRTDVRTTLKTRLRLTLAARLAGPAGTPDRR